jgi:hypothetical protein
MYCTGEAHPGAGICTHPGITILTIIISCSVSTTVLGDSIWMYSFLTKEVMMLSDPKHWDHILTYMQPGDVPHRIGLTDTDIHTRCGYYTLTDCL